MDGIVYGVAAALGFATLENILYVFSAASSSEALVIGATRALISVPGHALFAVPWGYAMGVAKFRPPEKRAGILCAGLAVGVAFHMVFNFLLGNLIGFALLIVVAVPFMWRYGGERIRRALRRE
jgi:RsiW-degrading membrane proteinase PrsW (M82 family)